MSIRHYINLVEHLNEATWWPTKKPPPSFDPNLPRVMTSKPPERPPNNFSAAVNDLNAAVYQISIGHSEYYDQADHLAGQLLQQAPASGMDQYVPTLNQIVGLLNRGEGERAQPLVRQLVGQFKQQMAANPDTY